MNINAVKISAEPTPNPNTFKFVFDRVLLERGTADFPHKAAASGSPLAERLFAINAVTGVFVGQNFVTVTKTPQAGWDELAAPVVDALRAAIAAHETVSANTPGAASAPANEGELEGKIREVLDREIRPAVAMDGGDITFHSYHNGVVTLQLRGACSACPSATFTLKIGVENRLKSLFPEVKEVVQL